MLWFIYWLYVAVKELTAFEKFLSPVGNQHMEVEASNPIALIYILTLIQRLFLSPTQTYVESRYHATECLASSVL